MKWKGDIAPWREVHSFGGWCVGRTPGRHRHRVDVFNPNATLQANGNAFESWGIDGFSKLDIDGFSFVAYGYYGAGLGTTGLFFDAFDLLGNPRTTWGGYGQASYTWDKFTFGGSYGISAMDPTAFDSPRALPTSC